MNTTATSSGNSQSAVHPLKAQPTLKPFARALTVERFGISSDAVTFNGTILFKNGQYTGSVMLPETLRHFVHSSDLVDVLVASFYESCEVLNAVYQANNKSFSGTLVEQHFRLMRQAFAAFPVIELEIDDEESEPAFMAFCDMLTNLGFVVTFDPKTLVNPSARLQNYADACPPLIRHWYATNRNLTTVTAIREWLTDFASASRGSIPSVTTQVVTLAG